MRGKKKGLTLVELIAVMAIMTIVFSIIFQIYTFYYRTYSSGMNNDNVQSTRAKVMNDVSESISEAQAVDTTVKGNNFTLKTSNNTITGTEIVAITPADGTSTQCVYVLYNKTTLYKCTNIVNNSSSNCIIIAYNVNYLEIASQGNNLYNIGLTVIGNTQEFQTNIAMRNMGV